MNTNKAAIELLKAATSAESVAKSLREVGNILRGGKTKESLNKTTLDSRPMYDPSLVSFRIVDERYKPVDEVSTNALSKDQSLTHSETVIEAALDVAIENDGLYGPLVPHINQILERLFKADMLVLPQDSGDTE